MKITIDVSEQNESTESPYWLILDPSQNMRADIDTLASQITGPYFSREEAEFHLKNRRYAFGTKASVYCLSGYWSSQYREALKEEKNKLKRLAAIS